VHTYPKTPADWTPVARQSAGPFTTHVSYRRPDGAIAEWSSRRHRKHASRISRPASDDASRWWAPHRASWWIGILFAIGATCFFVGPLPGFAALVGSAADASVFFIGSIFFTTAAALQCLETFNTDHGPDGDARPRFRYLAFEPRRIDWWSSVVQFAGTIAFNATTFRALQTGIENSAYDRLVWAPDAIGSICFLVSGYLAYVEVCGRFACWRGRSLEWKIATVNFVGCIAFGISAVAAYVVPSTGSEVDLAGANLFTALGGLCFLVGAVLLLPEGAPQAEASP
jgi:hypothetical protein